MNLIKSLLKDEEGQSTVEYMLLIRCIAPMPSMAQWCALK